MGSRIRILLADDHAFTRSRLRSLLHDSDDLSVIGETTSGAAVVERTRTEQPDVVLIDIRPSRSGGLTAARQITKDPALEDVGVIVLLSCARDEAIFEALQAGASGVLLKNVEPDVLCRAVRAVARGDALLSPNVTRRLISEFVSQPRRDRRSAAAAAVARLTAREREVMGLVAGGLANREIAERLRISPATVKTHMTRLRTKLEARDRAHIVVLAYETGLVTATAVD